MSESNKSYRIRTNVGEDTFISVNLEQDYDTFDILSLKIRSLDVYKLHNSNYGVIVGRVLANNGFGIPNVKISVFIKSDGDDDADISAIYPFSTASDKNSDGVRYNLLPDNKVADCHQVVGTFPNKRYVLDNDAVLEVFDKYYKYTVRTNNAGDYMICGVPTGEQMLHMDLDLSDCGILSQRPRDFVYKGYTVEQFENPNMFKQGTEYSNLSQIFTQNQVVYVQPFWGNESLGETIGITRADINVAFKFEPTCVFIGSVVSDNASQGFSKKCIPTEHMGDMDELTTGEGTIEMIRKTYAGNVEEFQIKGTEIINGDGIWCYQIPMNLDYMMTDEYGNMVPTDNPERGIPTRTRVRFRISMQDMEQNTDNYFRAKVLVPHNPQNLGGADHEDYDYEFGTYTRDESFRDLFWNNVYTVKSYIPRIQKRKVGGWKEHKFTGIKHCQNFASNNPMPYNNMRIEMPFMFKVMCILVKTFIKVTGVINTLISMFGNLLADLGDNKFIFKKWKPFHDLYEKAIHLKLNVIDEGLCPDLENWYFAPMSDPNALWISPNDPPKGMKPYNLLKQTLESITTDDDPTSIEDGNRDEDDEATCLTVNTDYLISCIEMNLANEYKVVNFDFYNDWINGVIYFPRWMRFVRNKVTFLGITWAKAKVKGCMDNTKIFSKSRKYTQMCSLGYGRQTTNNHITYTKVNANVRNRREIKKSNNFHKKRGLTQVKVFGKNGGICHEKATMTGQYVYYLKPCEWTLKTAPLHRKVNLFATDLVLLGSLNDCDMYGIPQAFRHLSSSSYIMPTNLALSNMENDGPLYTYGKNGSICSKSNQTQMEDTEAVVSDSLRRLPNNSLTAELQSYSGASSNYDTAYDSEESDTVAITEAAGISWNWSGPQQGEIDEKKMYYPGGHFLGLSCANAQTNIKTCVNLERICELGSALSQRKEDVRAVSSGDGVSELSYVYTVPTGLISGDDIIDDEFRVMFATMNHNRLIATKLNRETGYKTYDFDYVNPINFGGEMSKYTAGAPYNGKVVVEDESDNLSLFGIIKSLLRMDYDKDEPEYTQRKTTEMLSVDYYMFRLGLSYDDMKKSNTRHLRQFATEKDGNMYLPQYENSFYFYFGMHNGSTALDEFSKQFFSECDSSHLMKKNPNLYVSVEEFSLCDGTSNASVSIENMEPPYSYVLANATGETISSGHTVFENVLDFYDLGRDDYIITVTDMEGVSVSNSFSVGKDKMQGLFTPYDFNLDVGDGLARTADNKDMYYGGYVNVEGVFIDGEVPQSAITVYAVKDMGDPATESETFEVCDASGNTVLYLASANTPYDIYAKYQYTESCSTVYLYATTVTLKDSSTVGLTMGPVKPVPYYELPTSGFTDEWWYSDRNNIDDDTSPTYNQERNWNIRKSLINGNADSSVTFSSSVKAVNGTKAIWGTPQNMNGFYTVGNINYTSENEAAVPSGYTLDDDASYRGTYGLTEYSTVKHYNATAYNGLIVCGRFAAKAFGSGTTKTLEMVASEAAKMREGCGCMLKPLPDGDLIPCSYEGGKLICYGNADEISMATSGVVYPTIIYPTIKKPFSVNANYFIVKGKELTEAINEDGDTYLKVENPENFKKCEGRITNGVTYRQHYCGDSYMSLVCGEGEDYVQGSTKIQASKGDLEDISIQMISNSITYLSGYTSGDVESYSYSISEGYPMYRVNERAYTAYRTEQAIEKNKDSGLYAAEANTAALSLDAIFYDNILYSKPKDNLLYFKGEGYSDSDINYYYIRYGALSNVFYTSTDGFEKYFTRQKGHNIFDWITKDENPRNLYIVGTYTDRTEYDVIGSDVVIQLRDSFGGGINAFVPWTEETEDGLEIKTHKFKVSNKGAIHKDDIQNIIENIIVETKGRVEFPKKKSIVTSSKTAYENSSYSWTKSVLNKCNESALIRQNIYSAATVSDDFVVVGVKRYNDDPMSMGNICKIYLYPGKVNNLNGEISYVALSETAVPHPVSSITYTYSGASKTYYVISNEKTSWTASTDASWLTFLPLTGATPEGAISAATPVQITHSLNEGEERTCNIKLIGQNGKETMIPVIQEPNPSQGLTTGIWTNYSVIERHINVNFSQINLGPLPEVASKYQFVGETCLPLVHVKNIHGTFTLHCEVNGVVISDEWVVMGPEGGSNEHQFVGNGAIVNSAADLVNVYVVAEIFNPNDSSAVMNVNSEPLTFKYQK